MTDNSLEMEHLKKLREGVPGCTVLLKKNGDFPLESPCRLALYGSGARRTVKGGTGSGEVNSRYFVTIEDGLKNAGFTITTEEWLDAYDKVYEKARKGFIDEIKERAKKLNTKPANLALSILMPEPEYDIPCEGEGDVAVYVMSRISGEGSDRQPKPGDVLMSESEIRDITAISGQYNKFILVINAGGPVDISPVADKVDNILVFSQLGAISGDIFADIILGASYPSGKLATTWAKADDYPSIGDFAEKDDTIYREGVYVGYRYFDSVDQKPLFPFGFGLSYTTFELSDYKIAHKGETIEISTEVKNTGARPGREVVQVYVSKPDGAVDTPYQELCAFKKSGELSPGDSERVTCEFNMSDITVYDESSAAYTLYEGDYLIRVGTSSEDTALAGVVRLSRDYRVKQVKNVADSGEADWKPDKKRSKTVGADGVTVIELDDSDIIETKVSYDREFEIDERIQKISDEDLALTMVGAYEPGLTADGTPSDEIFTVAGAVGETSAVFEKYGIKQLAMADGPAGLRLARDYFEDEKGVHAIGATMPETMAELMTESDMEEIRLQEKKPANESDIRHQYCTALPIATAIAQSFDTDFAAVCGDIVGAEMELFGIHLWLAPGMNIHRNIRCGRNFEYFSEDPYVTGMMAAAITNAVQAHHGCGVTVKHFACNNQETNRSNSNSVVSDRALREIYLRGFELCMKYASPAALMTSYNLLNGIHTASNQKLIKDILRFEFGYDGVVMTDWWVEILGNEDSNSKHHRMAPHEVTAGGGDLFMPGSKKDYDDVLDSVKDGSLDRRQLEINATRIAALADRLTK